MIIAFPPCTHLAVSGAAWFDKKLEDGRQHFGVWFFLQFIKADCEKIVIENPVGIMSGDYLRKNYAYQCNKYGFPQKPTQKIHPWMFGDDYSKTTCLWIKGVEPLKPLITKQPELEYFECIDSKTGKKKRMPKWYADAFRLPSEERQRVRSKTFPGIAKAMAEQWG